MSETIGEQLQRSRLESKRTLQEVAHATHIRLHYLEALEQNQRELLPSTVQGRGFLRLYAGFLGLEVQPLLDAWDGKPDPQPPPAEEAPPPKEAGRRKRRWRREPIVETLPPENAGPLEEDRPEKIAAGETAPKIPQPGEPLTASDDIFREIGQALRAQREALSLKISDVERFTYIRHRYVEALEKGTVDELPSPVQGRGMLANYARFLGLDTEKLMLRFADGLQTRRLEYAGPKTTAHRLHKKRPTLLTPDLLVGGLVILFLFGFAIWGASQVSAIRQEQQRAAAGEATLEPVANVMLTVSLAPFEIGTRAAEPTSEPGPLSPEQPPAEGLAEAPAEGEAPLTLNTAQSPAGPLQLYLVASQRAYLRIVADDKEVFNGRVVPGNAYQFSGKEKIELTTGNAAALQVFFNQNDLGALGKVGQVVSLLLDKNGVITPTAIFTATPSATLYPTQTPTATPTSPPVATPTITPYIP